MPNIKSAKKRVLVSGVRNERNKADKSALKTALKKFEAAAAEGNRTEAESAYKVAVKSVDKAAAKGILHKNNAAHKKSALTLKLNSIGYIEREMRVIRKDGSFFAHIKGFQYPKRGILSEKRIPPLFARFRKARKLPPALRALFLPEMERIRIQARRGPSRS